ncbi:MULTISPECIES: hypothetical protein [unclassified Methylobacterium]|uniref:hypothetical protein n=1 Tax=unclassified Methylobacterium TaxID=2615210 RepID=UPI00037ACAE9|nr:MULTISPECIES: hypothetical protein [unclassified Methylobacterium]TXN33433.1 hypothetical protein FV220_02270 [Methylobacterium sp. WL19]
MTISAFTAGTYFQDRNTANLVSQKARLDALTTQLSTGRNAETYGGIGSARTTSLSAHASLSALDGYDAAINANTTRVTVASSAVTQLSNLSGIVQGSLNSGSIASGSNAVQVARNSLDAAVDALNQDVAGNYIFGGRDSDAPPVASSDAILNGVPSRNLDGLKTVVSEQIAADLGPNGNGRIATSVSGSTVTVSEEGTGAGGTEARANFGFSLVSAASSNPAAITAGPMTARTNPDVTFSVANAPAEGDRIRVAINQPDGTQSFTDLIVTANPPADSTNTIPLGTAAETAAALTKKFQGQPVASIQGKASLGLAANFGAGTPASVELNVKTPPAAGDTLTFKLALRDGTTQTITLTAKANADAKSTTEFSLTGDVAANISTALSNALKETAGTTLSASSASRATQDFFAGSKTEGLAPRRVSADGNGYAEGASATTVIWYTGDDTSTDPRATASVQIGSDRKIGIGAQANEAPIRAVLAGIAQVAVQSFTTTQTGTSEAARYLAVAERSRSVLTSTNGREGLQAIASDLGLAAKTMTETKADNRAARATLQDSLDGVDTVSLEEVTAKLLALQNQLQASYQVTSMLSKLTLTNYLS